MSEETSGKMKKTKTKPSRKIKKTKDVCFVIMPFGGWGDDYYETIYCTAIEAAGLDHHRADDLFRPSTIVNDIWTYTKKAKLLLADLSGRNPNVFYELGLAHALAKPVILVAETMDEIPFDLRALRIITYEKHNPEWGRILREKIVTAIKEVLVSPLEAIPATFMEVKKEESKTQITPHEKEIIEIKQELDLLKREIRIRQNPIIEREEEKTISSEDARFRIRRFLRMKMPKELIIKRLADLGVPSYWTLKEIELANKNHIKKNKIIKTSRPSLLGER